MKSKLKWISGILGAVLALSLVFGAGVYAAQNWLSFTGDGQIEQSESNVNEILDILEEVAARGDMTAEELAKAKDRIQELEDMNPSGLAKQNKELRGQVEQLSADLESKQNEIEEKSIAYDELQKERDGIVIARDNAIAERDNLQAQYDTLNEGYSQLQTELTQANEYVIHLEEELERANEAVASHAQNTNTAVEKARTYKE